MQMFIIANNKNRQRVNTLWLGNKCDKRSKVCISFLQILFTSKFGVLNRF